MNLSLEAYLKAFQRKQLVAAALGLLILAGLSVVFANVYLTGQAEQEARLLNQVIRFRDFRIATEILEQERHLHFRVIRFRSPQDRISFTLPEIADLQPDNSLWNKISNEKITVETIASDSSVARGELSFEYNRFLYVPHAFVTWLFLFLASIVPMSMLRKRVVEQFNRDLHAREESLKADLARKVRHNIRTPLAALIRLSDTIKGLRAEDVSLFQSIIGHIRFLVSELDAAKPAVEISDEKIPIFDCLRDSFREQKLVTAPVIELSCDIDDSLASAQVQFVYHEFRSILSNVCANSREAIDGSGKITLSAKDLGNEIEIRIQDTGGGIDPKHLSKVTEKGFSRGKLNGSGLGLYHAGEHLNAWRGRIKIESEVGVGTTVTIHLPIANREAWYTPRIKFRSGETVVVVDDQISIHHLWDMRLNEVGFKGQKLFYFSGREAIDSQAFKSLDLSRSHVFMDHELGPNELPGLEILKNQFIEAQRYLVTGNFDQLEIRKACDEQGVTLIPKTELPVIPIVAV